MAEAENAEARRALFPHTSSAGSNVMHLTDEELVRRYKQGDDQTFETIYERYYPPLMRFMTRMCGNAEDAQETLQDAFLSIFRHLGDFRGESSLKNWMYKVAARACWKSKAKQKKTLPLGIYPRKFVPGRKERLFPTEYPGGDRIRKETPRTKNSVVIFGGVWPPYPTSTKLSSICETLRASPRAR